MPRLSVFNSISLDGYFTTADGDISWAHANQDAEWAKFTTENAKGGAMLLFGRVTYEMMSKYWPTPAAAKDMPEVAAQMNKLPKVVFSKTMDKATWENTTVVKGDIAAEVRKLKAGKGQDMLIMGSGTIVSQLTEAGLIDSYEIVIVPVVLGKGRTMFEGVTKQVRLKRTSERAFGNGNVYVTYEVSR
jgi:dihydrofolate reductase